MQIEVRAFRKSSSEKVLGEFVPAGSGIIDGVAPEIFASAAGYVEVLVWAVKNGRLYGFDKCTPDRLEFSCRAWPELHGTWLRLPDGWEKGGGNG